MQYHVTVTVRGEQIYEGGEHDHTELTADGLLENTSEGWILSYGEQGTDTEFVIGPQRIVLRRSGELRAEMVFEVGKTHTTVYELPFGSLPMEVTADSVRQKLSERGGLLELRYRITVGEQVKSENSCKVQIKRKIE